MPKKKKAPKKDSGIEINADFAKAIKLIEKSDKNVFITGRAGTGKSTLLNYFREHTAKNVAVLAPTGVAALNVSGQTIHSFFRFPATITPDTVRKRKPTNAFLDMLSQLEVLIIDEISMVRADMLDCIDEALRYSLKSKDPFGGIQMVFIGDLYQLPPVVAGVEERELFQTVYKSPYFFDAKVFELKMFDNFEMELVELEKIYRQSDDQFINLLNRIRNNSVTNEDIDYLNSRCGIDVGEEFGEFYITLTTTNASADAINTAKLAELFTPLKSFEAKVDGDFSSRHFPTATNLDLREGARVMMLNNDPNGRWVNGSMGMILDFHEDADGDPAMNVKLSEGKIVEVEPYEWRVSEYFYNKKEGRIDSETIGSFTQFPVRLAWAVTIHKSQGKTFDRVVMDIGHGSFAHGQVYVGLSRCTNFEGLILKRPIRKHHIMMDQRIIDFLTRFQYQKAEESMSLDAKVERISQAIENKEVLEIVYLKANDIKSEHTIEPRSVGTMEYQNEHYTGVKAYCHDLEAQMTFKVSRILAIKD